MSLCSSRNSDWKEVDKVNVASATKHASASPAQTVPLPKRIKLESHVQRGVTEPKLEQLVKPIYNKEPTLNSNPKDREDDIEKVKSSTVNASKSFVTPCLQKSSQEDDSEF